MTNLKSIPNFSTYSKKLIAARKANDENLIKLIFESLSQQCKLIRDKNSIRTERNKLTWNDPGSHFAEVQIEEVGDLKREFDDNLELFQLAVSIQYKPIMISQFAKMMQILSDIRKRTNSKFERKKNSWNDPSSHFVGIQIEEIQDLFNELRDQVTLFNIAKLANFDEGMDMILSKLGIDSSDEMTNPRIPRAHS